jgi:hypothetical protein
MAWRYRFDFSCDFSDVPNAADGLPAADQVTSHRYDGRLAQRCRLIFASRTGRSGLSAHAAGGIAGQQEVGGRAGNR